MSRIVRWIFVLATAFATNANAQVMRPLPDDSARLRLEAINLLQGHDTLPFLDTARVRLVAGALRAIRRELPQLADIPVGPDWSFLMLMPTDDARPLFVRRFSTSRPTGPDSIYWSDPARFVGVPVIDSLNRVFDVARVERPGPLGSGMLCLYFRQPVDVSVVAQSYARVPEVGYAGQQVYSGDGSRITLIPKGRRLHFVFARGGGDCPSGCTEWDYYYVTYDTLVQSVTLERRTPSGGKWKDPIAYWSIPTAYAIDPYPGIDSLYAGTRAKRWWYRQYAVEVLGRLLGNATELWYGYDEQGAAHFKALKEAALSRRRESYGALIERLGDSDQDVARLAHKYLRELTGQTFPGGEAGIAEWRKWLDQAP